MHPSPRLISTIRMGPLMHNKVHKIVKVLRKPRCSTSYLILFLISFEDDIELYFLYV